MCTIRVLASCHVEFRLRAYMNHFLLMWFMDNLSMKREYFVKFMKIVNGLLCSFMKIVAFKVFRIRSDPSNSSSMFRYLFFDTKGSEFYTSSDFKLQVSPQCIWCFQIVKKWMCSRLLQKICSCCLHRRSSLSQQVSFAE